MKTLSLCTHFRDGYDGDSLYRLQTALDFLGTYFTRPNEHKIIICDWGCEEPLAPRLSVFAWQDVSVVRVNPEIVRQLEDGRGYSMPMALNTAIRRAEGDILSFDPDICISVPSHYLHNPSDFGYIPRRRIPLSVVQTKPNAKQILAITEHQWHRLKTDGLGFGYFNPCPGFMMSKEQWHAMGGYDESLFGWGWLDTDLTLRASQRYMPYDLSRYGFAAYHLDHRSTFTPDKPRCHVNDMPAFAANDENWGLGNYELEIDTPPLSETYPINNRMDSDGQDINEIVEFVQNHPGCYLIISPNWSDRSGLGPTDSWAYGFNKTLTEHDCWPGHVRIITG